MSMPTSSALVEVTARQPARLEVVLDAAAVLGQVAGPVGHDLAAVGAVVPVPGPDGYELCHAP